MSQEITLSNLPDIASASLPAAYESAKTALANCDKIDECKDWADKAAAMASYAKQADDDSLMNHAKRIRVRAIRRAGKLLEQIQPAPGRQKNRGGGSPNSRRAAARSAGMSEDQQKQAQRVARVPENDFNDQVESDSPPTVTALAEQGKKSSPFTYEQVRAAKSREALRTATKWVSRLTDEFTTEEIEQITDMGAADEALAAARILREIAKCIRKKT